MGDLSLYTITNGFAQLLSQESLSDYEVDILKEELTTLLEQKSENIIGYTKNIELTIDAMKMEEKRIADNRKALENRLNNFKDYVKSCMESANIQKVETSLGTLSLAKNPISIEVVNEQIVPNKYKKEVIEIKIDKKAITDDFKETGELIDGIRIINDKKSLRIR